MRRRRSRRGFRCGLFWTDVYPGFLWKSKSSLDRALACTAKPFPTSYTCRYLTLCNLNVLKVAGTSTPDAPYLLDHSTSSNARREGIVRECGSINLRRNIVQSVINHFHYFYHYFLTLSDLHILLI